MQGRAIRTVALVDPHTGGHHRIYMQYFVKTLLDMDYSIVLLFPEPDWIETWLISVGVQPGERLIKVAFQDRTTLKSKSHIFQLMETYFNTLRRWRAVRSKLLEIERARQVKIDFVFFAWLDSYLFKLVPRVLLTIFNRRWAGLYFHPTIRFNSDKLGLLQNDFLIGSKWCTGVAFLDRNIITTVKKRFKDKLIEAFPDISDDSAVDLSFAPLREIDKRANGRLVVGLIGLSKRKGALTLISLAKKSPPGFYFVFGGKIDEGGYDSMEFEKIQHFLSNLPENSYWYPDYVSESKYNSFIASFHILFAVYENFQGSSNVLTKAAIFKKPILVSDQFYMGEIVRQFELGVTCQESSAESCLEGLTSLQERMKRDRFNFEGHSAYQKINDVSTLNEKFRIMLPSDL